MKWFLQFLSLGSAVLYTLLVIIDNRIPHSTVENTVISEAQSKQRRLSSNQDHLFSWFELKRVRVGSPSGPDRG